MTFTPRVERTEGGKSYFLLDVESFAEWPDRVDLPTQHYVLGVFANASGVAPETIKAAMRSALMNGAVYVVAWGEGCDLVHDICDQLRFELDLDDNENATIMTTWHSDESVAEAVWFFSNSAFPDGAFTETCGSWLAVRVGEYRSNEQIEAYLADPARLAADVD